MPSYPDLVIVLLLCAVLSFISYRLRLLTLSGSIASFVMGVIIGLFGSINWLILLIAFALLAFLVTRFKLEVKVDRGVQEGKKGERTYKNVLANSLIPTLVAVGAFALGEQDSMIAGVVYLTAISVAASDTIASELGVLSDRTRLITTMRPVPPGTDGGVSVYGTFWALMGALIASLLGWLVLFPGEGISTELLVPIVFGFMGCMVDSLVGATLERRGIVSKLGTNIISMAVGTLAALTVLLY
jgi:uncharacterized protein (TIGR00297 family)